MEKKENYLVQEKTLFVIYFFEKNTSVYITNLRWKTLAKEEHYTHTH